MTANDLISQFNFNQQTLKRLLADVTHEESLILPDKGGNSLNWVLGHLIATRSRMLVMLGAEPLVGKDDAVRYTRGAQGYSKDTATRIEDLKKLLDESFARLKTALTQAEATFGNPADSPAFIRDGETIGDRVGYFACHEAYHTGQIGLLRRLLGKSGLF
jgi:uncharacterized damage-inducible protein DinB